MIHKMFDGRHIDLSKIVEVMPAEFDDRMGSGGWFVCFAIVFQLLDEPRVYTYNVDHFINLPDNWTDHTYNRNFVNNQVAVPAVAALQTEVDKIIELWKGLIR